MTSLPVQLRRYLREGGDWVAKNTLCRMEFRTKKGGTYGADLISRTLRTLEERKEIAVKYIDNHSYYKYIPDYLRERYISTSEREAEVMFKP